MPSPNNHGRRWTSGRLCQLYDLYDRAMPMSEIADTLGRSPDAVRSKLREILGVSFPYSPFSSAVYNDRQRRWASYCERNFIHYVAPAPTPATSPAPAPATPSPEPQLRWGGNGKYGHDAA